MFFIFNIHKQSTTLSNKMSNNWFLFFFFNWKVTVLCHTVYLKSSQFQWKLPGEKKIIYNHNNRIKISAWINVHVGLNESRHTLLIALLAKTYVNTWPKLQLLFMHTYNVLYYYYYYLNINLHAFFIRVCRVCHVAR